MTNRFSDTGRDSLNTLRAQFVCTKIPIERAKHKKKEGIGVYSALCVIILNVLRSLDCIGDNFSIAYSGLVV